MMECDYAEELRRRYGRWWRACISNGANPDLERIATLLRLRRPWIYIARTPLDRLLGLGPRGIVAR